ncbi:MAG: biotin/lipoyl-containing protein, partial [Pseudomonadota bacterium]
TGLIAARGDDLIPASEPDQNLLQTAALHLQREYVGLDHEPLTGFRLNAPQKRTVLLEAGNGPIETRIPDDWIDDIWSSDATPTSALVSSKGNVFAISQYTPHGEGAASAADGAILAPMPGKVIAVDVSEGDAVTAGQRLMVLEAMKMEHALTAPFDGTVTGLEASEGGQVQVEAVLCVVEPSE